MVLYGMSMHGNNAEIIGLAERKAHGAVQVAGGLC
jgi:hypothetical protein